MVVILVKFLFNVVKKVVNFLFNFFGFGWLVSVWFYIVKVVNKLSVVLKLLMKSCFFLLVFFCLLVCSKNCKLLC